MSGFLLFILVAGVLYYVNRGYNTSYYHNINLNANKKQQLKGELKEHEAGILVALLAKVAKADGNVSDIEAKLLSHIFSDIANTFENSEAIRGELKRIYNNELKGFDNIPNICENYLKLNTSYSAKISLLQTLLTLAFVDLDFSDGESMVCEDIANFIKIRKNDFDELIRMFDDNKRQVQNEKINTTQNAYEVLGVSQNSSLDEVKKAYRALVKKNHPDILRGKGADDKGIRQANIKLQEINNAYEILKKENKI